MEHSEKLIDSLIGKTLVTTKKPRKLIVVPKIPKKLKIDSDESGSEYSPTDDDSSNCSNSPKPSKSPILESSSSTVYSTNSSNSLNSPNSDLPKSKKQKLNKSHPTYEKMVIEAFKEHKRKNGQGWMYEWVSIMAIRNTILKNYPQLKTPESTICNPAAVNSFAIPFHKALEKIYADKKIVAKDDSTSDFKSFYKTNRFRLTGNVVNDAWRPKKTTPGLTHLYNGPRLVRSKSYTCQK